MGWISILAASGSPPDRRRSYRPTELQPHRPRHGASCTCDSLPKLLVRCFSVAWPLGIRRRDSIEGVAGGGSPYDSDGQTRCGAAGLVSSVGYLQGQLPEAPFFILENACTLLVAQVISNPRVLNIRRDVDGNEPGKVKLGGTLHRAQFVADRLHLAGVREPETDRAVAGCSDKVSASKQSVWIGRRGDRGPPTRTRGHRRGCCRVGSLAPRRRPTRSPLHARRRRARHPRVPSRDDSMSCRSSYLVAFFEVAVPAEDLAVRRIPIPILALWNDVVRAGRYLRLRQQHRRPAEPANQFSELTVSSCRRGRRYSPSISAQARMISTSRLTRRRASRANVEAGKLNCGASSSISIVNDSCASNWGAISRSGSRV